MTSNIKSSRKIMISASLIWIGFLGAISFMESWLKFRATGVTLEIGLSIGKLVFFALNKVEIFLALVIITAFILSKQSIIKKRNISFLLIIIILIIQSIYLLPQLDYRAEQIIDGFKLAKSYLHLYYVAFEAIKLLLLSSFTHQNFKTL
ncbi:hypothetical protein FUA24_06705 [Seonamhaeicola marinus]|uniref:DUF4149 domain-containing protein n=1 Tax=Seonamhaeicola marinus TaxID=1912246 RepID=A0A5D0IMU0_9FLAO|nr:hypothetical protein FUA24_06705 [Seonamhaeicola marinus]